MKDDLFERLRAVDPVTDERITQESRALGTTPGRIVASEPSNVRRFPAAARRKATLVAVAAVVVVAIAIPLTLLGPLGEGGGTPGDEPGDWVAVGRLTEIRDQGIVYVPRLNAFVIAELTGDPYALSATATVGSNEASGTADERAVVFARSRALYCEPTERFVDLAGNVFDRQGGRVSGAKDVSLSRLPTRIVDGDVQIDAPETAAVWTVNVIGQTPQPRDLGCVMAGGIPLEGRPGFGIPNGTALPAIAVALPQAGMRLTSPATVTGSADVFEATVSIRVLDETGTMIAEAFTTATCGTGCRGDFSTQLDFAVDHEQAGTVQVFESSAKDGSMINTVEIPVTLVPSTPSPTDGLEGTWFDANDQPLPNGSPDADGNVINVYLGAEHCQWRSVTFMNIGWPVGTLSNARGDWRQYVRDPEGLFDDGALHVGYLSDTSLPSDAADTGYHRGPRRLWVSPSQADDAVFVVNADTGAVERWGRATPPIICE